MSQALDKAAAETLLSQADWLRRAPTQCLLTLIEAGGFAARAVGGAVRNTLMDLPVDDIDIATTALPQAVTALAEAAGARVVPTGIEHGTVTVILAHAAYEVTTLRRDVSTDGRRATIAFSDDWRMDAERRDFTINALYCDAHGQLFDEVGGLADIAARRVRFIGDADHRIREDYLRILRFYRFFARFGTAPIDQDGHDACARNVAGMAQLSGERLRAEMLKLLAAPKALEAIAAMHDAQVLPAVLGGMGNSLALSRLITAERILARPPDGVLRLAALAVQSPADANRVAQRLRLSNAEQQVLADAAAPLSDMSDGERLYRFGSDRSRHMLLLTWVHSSAEASDTNWQQRLRRLEQSPVPVLPVAGADLIGLGLKPGPDIGRRLARAERAWIDSGFVLDRAALMRLITE